MDEYKTILQSSKDEFIEKRSRFIGYCMPVKTEEEAINFINKIKEEHWDATHNVYAYKVRKNQIKRYSDDGEPQGTAGLPMLDIIVKSELTDIALVATRYFGGIKLGGGGLVRAYAKSARVAIDAGKVITMEKGYLCKIVCSYNQHGRIASLIPELGGKVVSSVFEEEVTLEFNIGKNKFDRLERQFAEATNGERQSEILEKKYFIKDE